MTCPSTTLCVGADSGGNVYTTTEPDERQAGRTRPVDPGGNLRQRRRAPRTGGCAWPSARPCRRRPIRPAGPGRGARRPRSAPRAPPARRPRSACSATAPNDIYVSTDPSGGPSTYHEQHTIDSHSVFATITGIVCPSDHRLPGGRRRRRRACRPTPPRPGRGGRRRPIPPAFLNSISCPSTTLCVAVDDSGNAIVGTRDRRLPRAARTSAACRGGPAADHRSCRLAGERAVDPRRGDGRLHRRRPCRRCGSPAPCAGRASSTLGRRAA